MKTRNIQTLNFLNLLRSGAFNDSKPIGIMSAFKWDKLVQLAWLHKVTPYFASGIEHYYYDDNLNIPEKEIEKIRLQLKDFPSNSYSSQYKFDSLHLRNKKLNSVLRQIIDKEYSDPEKSYETMQLMAILIVNVGNILSGRSYLKGIIDLGRYLRSEGNKVDFVKLESWLTQTRMLKMANLQGNMLVEGFGFDKSELPFVSRSDTRSRKSLYEAIRYDDLFTLKAWDFHENKTGFIIGSPRAALHSIRHALGYRRYAPSETYSTIWRGVMNGLAEIEE